MQTVPMNSLIRRRSALADEVVASHRSWREASENVRTAYRRWVDSAPHKRDLEFAIYRVALDMEERAAIIYSERSVRAEALAR
jgi:hypothetical protein